MSVVFQEKDFSKRLIWTQWIVAISFLILILRLWQLQIIRGSEYLTHSIKNRTRLQKIQAPRGFIYDAKGRVLAKNNPSFNVCLVPQYKNQFSTQERLIKMLSLNSPFIQEKTGGAESLRRSSPIKIKEDISREELGLVAQDELNLPGVMIDIVPKRVYAEGNLAAHLLGYVGEASKEDLAQGSLSSRNYKLGDYLGKSGVELSLDEVLRGDDGYVESEVDALGQRTRVLTEKTGVPGKGVFLTIDLDLQRLGEECLGKQSGALVALDPRDGRILAMVSHPSFDPNLFSQRIAKRSLQNLLSDPSCPLINRVIHSQLPPGSIYKVVCAIAGLEEGVINPNTTFYCPGYLRLGNRVFGCWNKRGHGRVNLKKAIISSCDVYFYQLGVKLGVDRLRKYARLLGLGEKTGIGLRGEKAGLVPSYRWKKERFGRGWSAGEVACLAIGQGYNLVTPLQIASLYSAMANGGVLYLPQYVLGVSGEGGKVRLQFSPRVIRRASLSLSTLEVVRDALWGVVNSPAGTGWRGRVPGIEVAGKTGTAQVVEKGRRVDRRLSDHAWFVAFAPTKNPKVTVAAVIEHGGHGGAAAAPVVQKFLAGWKKAQGE
jgi:penicillin-binding protein 2